MPEGFQRAENLMQVSSVTLPVSFIVDPGSPCSKDNDACHREVHHLIGFWEIVKHTKKPSCMSGDFSDRTLATQPRIRMCIRDQGGERREMIEDGVARIRVTGMM